MKPFGRTSLLMVLMPVFAFAQNLGPADSQFIKNFGIDYINIQSLTVGLDIPVISKAGAIPFSYELKGANGCETFTSISGRILYRYLYCGIGINKSYASLQNNWSLTGVAPSRDWSASAASAAAGNCAADGKALTKYSNIVLTAPDLTTYYLNPNDTAIFETGGDGTSCNQAVDDFTYQGGVHVHLTSPQYFTVTLPNGIVQQTLTLTETDTFGNTISSLSGPYTDTLDTTALTVSDSAGSETDTYKDTTGTNVTVSVKTTSETITTNVTGCSYATTKTGNLVTEVEYPDNVNVYLGYEPVSGGGYTGRLASVTPRTGATISYSYGSNGACPLTSVNSVSRTTPDGTTSYTQAIVQSGTNYGSTTTVLDPGMNKTVYTFMGTDVKGNPISDIPLTMTEIEVYQNTGTISSPLYSLLSTTLFCYNGNQANCSTTQAAYPIAQTDTYFTPGNKATSSRVSSTLDSYGNITSSAKYDFGSSTFTLKSIATYGSWNGSSCVAVGGSIVDLPCDVTTTDGTHTISETRSTYNSGGALVAKSAWTGSQWLGTSYTRNANGTMASVTDANNQQTTFGYAPTGSGGCNGLLATSSSTTVNGIVLSSANTWDCNEAVILTTKDANGNGTSMQYDSMFRPVVHTDPSGYQLTHSYTSNSDVVTASFGSSVQNHVTYIDSLGRFSIGQTQQGPSSSYYDTTSAIYSYNGPNKQVSSSSPCTQTANQTCSTYSAATADPLGRPIASSDALGGIASYSYDQNDSSVTSGPAPSGEHVKTVQTESDGLGRRTSTCALETTGGVTCGQVMGNSGILTSYSYSYGAGSSTVTANRGSQTHTTVSDALGRLTSHQTPERGTVVNTYDSYSGSCAGLSTSTSPGDLLLVTKNSGVRICFVYDKIHRLIATASSGTPATCQRSAYDSTANHLQAIPSGYPTSGTNIIGRMVEAETDNCSVYPPTTASMITDEWFAYDKNGRMTDMWEESLHSGGFYHTSVTYNPNGTVSAVNGLPGYAGYSFGVDGEGRVNSVSQGSTVIVNNSPNGVTFDPAGRPLTIPIGTSGDNDTYTYDALERMKTYTFSVNGTTDTGHLTWNQNGSLASLSITDGFYSSDSQNCTFSYDDVSRLVTDNCGSSLWNQSYSYDQYNNLTKTGNPGTTWNPGYNSSNNQFIGSRYDNDGDLTYDGVNSYSWNAFGKMLGAQVGNNNPSCGSVGSYCATYDAGGRLVESNSGGTYTEILYGPTGRLGKMNGQAITELVIPLPGGLSLEASGSGGATRIVQHSDWIGTARLGTSLAGRTMSYDAAYSPYGESYITHGSVKQDFTGDLQDIFTGLFDTPNREFATNASRWLSPDPAGAVWNAYAYSTDPNRMTDPSGLFPKFSPARDIGKQDMPYFDWGGFGELYNWSMGFTWSAAAPMDELIGALQSQTASSTTGTTSSTSVPTAATVISEQAISSFAAWFADKASSAWAAVIFQGAPQGGPDAGAEDDKEDDTPESAWGAPLEPLKPGELPWSRGWDYNLMEPGPLQPKDAANFAGGQYTFTTVGADGMGFDTPYFRVYGDQAKQSGSWYALVPQVGGVQSMIDLALPAGNSAEYSICVFLPPGTPIAVGPIGYQGGFGLGGLPGPAGLQVFVPYVGYQYQLH